MHHRIMLLLGFGLFLLLVAATPVLSQQPSGIIVTGAAARFDTSTTGSSGLDNTFRGVRDRIIVQSAAALQGTVIPALPPDFRTLLDRVAPRIIVQSAQASTSYELVAPGRPNLEGNVQASVTADNKPIIEFTTNVPVSVVVRYGTQSGNYTRETRVEQLGTSFRIELELLTALSQTALPAYYYQITMTSGEGITFTTSEERLTFATNRVYLPLIVRSR